MASGTIVSSALVRSVVVLALVAIAAGPLAGAMRVATAAVASHIPVQFGYDVAGWNPVINGVRAAREDFVFANRMVSTGLVEDPNSQRNLAQTRSGGLIPGGYHYVVHGVDPGRQADFFLSKLGDQRGPLIEVDIETYDHSGYTVNPTCADVKAFIARLRERLGATLSYRR